MRKHIGTKVIVMVGILAAIFLGICVSNVAALAVIDEQNQQMVNVYLKMEKEDGEIAEILQELRLYANLSVLKEDEKVVNGVLENMNTRITDLNDSLERMYELCKQTGNEKMVESYGSYKEQISGFGEQCSKVKERMQAGNRQEAAEITNGIFSYITAADESKAAYIEALDEQITEATRQNSVKISGTYIFNLIMLAIFFIIVIIVVIIVLRTIARPAKQASKHLTEIVGKIENNEGDLTERITVKTKDEVGQLVQGVNSFMEQLQTVMRRLQKESGNIMESVNHITERVNMSNEDATNVSAVLEELAASMEEVSATLDQLASGSNGLYEEVKSMAGQADDGAGLVEEIKKRAQEISKNTTQSKQAANQMIQEIRTALETAVKDSRSVEKINELTGDILDITSQTNLLALNASIEAARAGEAGKGFAVVADEIRVLADNSRDTANNIQNISNMVTGAVERLSRNAEEMLGFIDEKVMKDYDGFVDMAKQYHDDADSMNDILSRFARNTMEMEHTMEDMNTGINDITSTVDESAKGVSNAAENAGNLVEAISHIQKEAENNQEVSRKLQGEVKRFKNV